MVWITNDEADALVSECYELFGHRGADLPIVGVDAAVFIGVLRRGDANGRGALPLPHGIGRMLIPPGRGQNHSICAGTGYGPRHALGPLWRAVIAPRPEAPHV